ncbi:ATP-dependent helicase [Neobacillus niacini]|uniref:ATP-dependent helicase n=1 Tax=Neobacillus niacini TaxID=86668 RepID=UPI0021CB80DA|nr:ATP-dependent helicase [Neobacillus niacini]MCM3767491.1 ATP-dependent helicase [Neobacillus niacini]
MRTAFQNKQVKTIRTTVPFASSKNLVTTELPPYLQELANQGIILDKNQAAAVVETDGALLVLAGAGSGKTRVLTARTAYMLEVKQIDPRSILLVTFTTKAAAEMKSRLLSYPKIRRDQINQLVTGTFHSIFYRILLFHESTKWSADKLIKKDWQRDKILKDAGKELDLPEKEFAFDLALQQIGFWKNNLIMPDEVKPVSPWEETTANLYKIYEEYKTKVALFDFDDMLIGCYRLFKSCPEVLSFYQDRFHYFLIDEYQDINKVQYELIKLLSAKNKNVCAVGDDDQAIYSFRGSDPTFLLEFETDFPNSKHVTLAENYRSTHEIVTVANQMIAANKVRKPKKMVAQYSTGQPPYLFFPYDEEEEATIIVTDIAEQIAAGANPADFAILYRTNAASRAVFERLATSNLPFKIDMATESFYDRYIVKSTLAFLKVSMNEEDPQGIADILPLLFLKQSVLKDLKAISILQDCSLLEAITQLKTTHSFQVKKLKTAVPLIRGLKGLSPVKAIETIETDIGFLDYLKKRGSESNQLDRGSDDLKDLKVAAKRFNTIDELLQHAEHMSAMTKEMKKLSKHFREAITLSTIHGSKGLEYKCVYLLGAVDGSLPHDYALESARSGDFSTLEEERRLFYVAMTRAQEQLFISVPENRRGKKSYRSRFLDPLLKTKKANFH